MTIETKANELEGKSKSSTMTATATATASTIDVIAPATLPEGATFEAVVDGTQFTAVVPKGGVREGGSFVAEYPSVYSSNSNNTNRVMVMAPTSLNAGDKFEAKVDGITFLATVPEGGVREGDIFEAVYPTGNANPAYPPPQQLTSQSQSQSPGTVPTGNWRTELCDIGDCTLCCMAFCCSCVVHAQVMQRLGLSLGGCPATNSGNAITNNQVCVKIVTTAAIVYTLYIGASVFFTNPDPNADTSAVYSLVHLLFSSVTVYFLVAFTCARMSMRARYQLPATCCNGGLDDCCITYWCSCCSAIQMARHTHDGRFHPYDACSQTGLGPNAPSTTTAWVETV